MTMADDNQTQGNEQPGAPPQAKNSDTPGEPMIPKSRFDEVNTRLRQLEAQLKAAADQQAAAEAERLKEQGAWKDLAEKRAADLDAAQRELESLRLTMMRRDVAAKVGLPSALIDRLVGSTPEELEADAQQLMAAMPKQQQAPPITGVPSTPAPSNAGGANDEGLRAQFQNFVRGR